MTLGQIGGREDGLRRGAFGSRRGNRVAEADSLLSSWTVRRGEEESRKRATAQEGMGRARKGRDRWWQVRAATGGKWQEKLRLGRSSEQAVATRIDESEEEKQAGHNAVLTDIVFTGRRSLRCLSFYVCRIR